ncbi:probable gluconokinase isoform X3 [Piliocolobus tephrosceles]|uniref:probable gluconokinase isoform X3 n=1 Tax=Piliocolobus tephrosceles TaxID=591936 RepID=UPI000C2A6E0C|nr:probable gluconokinase isoform X3 [Piliocolobus tephrosceles]
MAAPGALLVMGVSGSGNLTWKETALIWRVAPEGLERKEELWKPHRSTVGALLASEDRIPWLCNLHDILLRDVASGQHVVLACSALKKMYRDILTQGKDGAALKCEESGKEAKRAEMQLLVVHLSGSFEVISGRLLKRKGHFMPPELLQSQFETLEPPAAPENFIQISVDKNVSEIIATIMETLKMK